jgi:hypothetical protein
MATFPGGALSRRRGARDAMWAATRCARDGWDFVSTREGPLRARVRRE